MRRRGLARWSGLVGGVLLAQIAPAVTPLALSCLGCHQPRVDAPTMPALERFSADQIAASLRAARDHPDPASIMTRFAAGLSDADIDRLAHDLGHGAPAR